MISAEDTVSNYWAAVIIKYPPAIGRNVVAEYTVADCRTAVFVTYPMYIFGSAMENVALMKECTQ